MLTGQFTVYSTATISMVSTWLGLGTLFSTLLLFIVLVPFEIHQSSGILTISSTADLREWKSSYNLEVVASDTSQKISTPVTIHITKDAQDDATIEQFADKLNDLPEVLEYSVQENVEGNEAVVNESREKVTEFCPAVQTEGERRS